MSAVDLLAPVLDDGIRLTNFFNGRLLSAEDLRAEQAANRAQHAQLGRGLGAGVVQGLMVRRLDPPQPGVPRVRVSAGLAVDRLGQALELPQETEVRLVPAPEADLPRDAGAFGDCRRTPTDLVVSGTGVHLLLLTPASGFQGSAPASGLGTQRLPGGPCGSRWAVEGVSFRLLRLTRLVDFDHGALHAEALLGATDPAGRSRLRSLLAHGCLGSAALLDRLAAPRIPNPPGWSEEPLGVLDALRAGGRLGACEVPLALLLLGDAGLQLLDNWAARRPLLPVPGGADPDWPLATGARVAALNVAAFLQFQDQLADLLAAAPGPQKTLQADTRFAFLPAAGLLPERLDWRRFLGPYGPPEETQADEALLPGILRTAFDTAPFAVEDFSGLRRADGPKPVPLQVFRVPEWNADRVLFARATAHGRLRVFPEPAPSADAKPVATLRRADSNLTRDTVPHEGSLAADALLPGRYEVTLQAQGFDSPAPQEAVIIAGRVVDLKLALRPPSLGALQVRVLDAASGRPFDDRAGKVFASPAGEVLRLAAEREGVPRGKGIWLFRDLDPGAWLVTARFAGFLAPRTRVEVKAGVLAMAQLLLERGQQAAPPRCLLTEEAPPLAQRRLRFCLARDPSKLVLKTERVEVAPRGAGVMPAPRTERPVGFAERITLGAAGRDFDALVAVGGEAPPAEGLVVAQPLPDAVRDWLTAWQDWLGRSYAPGRTGGEPRLYLNPRFAAPRLAAEVPDRPQAWARFGPGFHVPLLLSLEPMRTRLPVRIRDARIPGLDPGTVDRLEAELDLHTLDDLAGLWAGYFAPPGGPPEEAGRHLVADAIARVREINEARDYLIGKDTTIARGRTTTTAGDLLARVGLDNDVALANADPDALEKLFGGYGGLALRLVEQARAASPPEAWRLKALDFTETQFDRLTQAGLRSQGDFLRRVDDPVRRAMLKEALGLAGQPADMAQAALDSLTTKAVAALTRGSATAASTPALTDIPGLTAGLAGRLAEAGLATPDALAAADAGAVAAVTGLDAARSEAVIAEAKRRGLSGQAVGRLATLAKADAQALAAAGIATLSELAAAPAERVAEVLGASKAAKLAGALVAGAQSALDPVRR